MRINGLARRATLVLLIVAAQAAVTAPASGEGVFPFKIEDATYNERVGAPLWGEFTGGDINAAEAVHKSATKSLGDPDLSFTYSVMGMSRSKGPDAIAAVDVSSAVGNDPGSAMASATAVAYNEFYLVVYNRMGTATSQQVRSI